MKTLSNCRNSDGTREFVNLIQNLFIYTIANKFSSVKDICKLSIITVLERNCSRLGVANTFGKETFSGRNLSLNLI